MSRSIIVLILFFASCFQENRVDIEGFGIFELLKNDDLGERIRNEILDSLSLFISLKEGISITAGDNFEDFGVNRKKLHYKDLLLVVCVDALELKPEKYARNIDFDSIDFFSKR